MATTDTHVESRPRIADAEYIRESIDQPEAFRNVFQRHHDRIRRYVVSRVGPQSADDVVSETFVAAFQARDRFNPDRSTDAAPWLLGIATNVIARHRASERRWLSQCSSELQTLDVAESFEDDSDARTDASRSKVSLALAIRRLPSREREPLLLHISGDLSYDQISAALGIPAGTVASRINRGRTRLAKWMEKAR
ncbi:MAG: RNA polymerase sigma factor [Thermoleophilia bacterium]|nr:RNA polymerase sigma factor [Thermoleophilia bacterium]